MYNLKLCLFRVFFHQCTFTEISYDEETILKIEDELSDVMYNVMTKCNVTFQVNDVHKMLQRKVHLSKGKCINH